MDQVLPGLAGPLLTVTMLDVDLDVEVSWGVWDENFVDGEYVPGEVAGVQKVDLQVGATKSDVVAVRNDGYWRRLYYGYGSEPETAYWPSFTAGPLVEEGPEPPRPPKEEVDDDQGWQLDEPPAEDASIPDEEFDGYDPPDYTVRLAHFVESTAMGKAVAFTFQDRGKLHVCTASQNWSRLFVVVFDDDSHPTKGTTTPGRWWCELPVQVRDLDFAWDSYRQKVVFVRRSPLLWADEDSNQYAETTVGEITPPDVVGRFARVDGNSLFPQNWALTPKAKVRFDTFTTQLIHLDSLATLEPGEPVLWGGLEHMSYPRFWKYGSSDVDGWRHWARARWLEGEIIGS